MDGHELARRRRRGARLEEAIGALLYDATARARFAAGAPDDPLLATLDAAELEETAAELRRMVLGRSHRGTGDLRDWYPRTLAAWLTQHPDDGSLDELMGRFCASPGCAAWREGTGGEPGCSVEEALFRFFDAQGIGEPMARTDEMLAAVVKALAVTPGARFTWPAAVRRAPAGCFAIGPGGTLFAALGSRYLAGPVTPIIRALLLGEEPGLADPIEEAAAAPVRDTLRQMGLLGA